MPGLDSEAFDFRAISESFAAFRKLARRDLETLRLVTDHKGRKVPTAAGMILFGKERERHFPDAWIHGVKAASNVQKTLDTTFLDCLSHHPLRQVSRRTARPCTADEISP